MSLSGFIRGHHEDIISEFAQFARTLKPPHQDMTEAELRDHAEEILTAAVQDMGSPQSPDEEFRKSRGLGAATTMARAGTLHADDRIRHGFPFLAVLAEFRALRATVLRLYEKSGASDLAEVRRFNEAIDDAMTASMDRFAAQTDLFRDQFIAVLSHDLRNPLAAVTMSAALLTIPEDNPERRARAVTRIMNSAQRMERMIGDLLDLTRTRLGGTLPLKRRPADLQQVCEDAIMEIRAAHPGALVQLYANGDLRGEWDADRLEQVVSNLLGNAIQHGSGTPITLTAQDEGNLVTLTVHNGGPPIPPEALPYVFEPLARGRADGASRSIGLGLFIARAIVSAHSGQIQVSSSIGTGTTFTITLPKNE